MKQDKKWTDITDLGGWISTVFSSVGWNLGEGGY